MSSYLFALIVSDFQCIKGLANAGLNGSLLIGSCGRPNVRDQLPFSLDAGIKSMEYLQRLYDIKYPLPKYGLFIFKYS
jgi:aminopeptidase N